MFKKLLISISILLMTNYAIRAEIYNQNSQLVLLLVGVKAQELAEHERVIFQGKRIIEVAGTDNWQETIKKTNASEIILKQNSGFTGLYTPSGLLVKSIDMGDGSNPASKNNNISPVQRLTYQENFDHGYLSGGRIDPYQPVSNLRADPQNNAKLAAGWGYNSQINHPKSKRSVLVDFLDYAPLDTVTPLNYPGHFDQANLTVAYGLGVIPHIGGLIAARSRAKANNNDYNYYKSQQPAGYVEYPIANNSQRPQANPYAYVRGNRHDDTNPITSDPNFIRYQQMPQAFTNQFPNYGSNSGGANLGFGSVNRAF